MPEINYVEAIEEGKIIKVREDYAKKEGLPIIRKPRVFHPRIQQKEEFRKTRVDDFRKPLNWKNNKIVKELMDNFHWEIIKKRKERNLTRKQLADSLNVSEEDIKLIENGFLPKDDFILVNKIEEHFKISLRRDEAYRGEMRKLIEEPKKVEENIEDNKNFKETIGEKEENKEIKGESIEDIFGDEIEVDEK